MPILPAEPDLFPEDLWQAVDVTEGGTRQWWCLHTLPRQEKTTARYLRSQNIAYYLPQVVKVGHTPQGRKTRSVAPLFQSYLFLLGDETARMSALRSNRLVKVLDIADPTRLTSDLRQIHQMLSSGLTVLPEPVMPVGAHVRITSGPLQGIEGTVVRRGKRDQFVAVVRFLGRGAMVELEDWQVERLDLEGERR